MKSLLYDIRPWIALVVITSMLNAILLFSLRPAAGADLLHSGALLAFVLGVVNAGFLATFFIEWVAGLPDE